MDSRGDLPARFHLAIPSHAERRAAAAASMTRPPISSPAMEIHQWPSYLPAPGRFQGFAGDKTPASFYAAYDPSARTPTFDVAPSPTTTFPPPSKVVGLAMDVVPFHVPFPPPPPPKAAFCIGCDEDTITVKMLTWYRHVATMWEGRRAVGRPDEVPPPPVPPGASRHVVYSLAYWQRACWRWWNHVNTEDHKRTINNMGPKPLSPREPNRILLARMFFFSSPSF